MQLSNAVGSIQASSSQQERFDEIVERISTDEFYVPTSDTIPSACIDGRIGGSVRPNAAGGTNSLAVSEDLTNSTSVGFLESFAKVTTDLNEQNLPIGGHDDEHADGVKCGCGACDRLADIYSFIAVKGSVIRDILTQLGMAVPDALHQKITINAEARHDFPAGPSLRDVMSCGTIDHLRGTHNEVVAVINTKKGTTLDRGALESVFGSDYEAFNVDVWSFEAAAKAISGSDEDAASGKEIAMLYYNLATAHVLCGPMMRVIVR